MKPPAQNLKLNIDGKKVTVAREHYVKAKTKQLREFGYSDLTEQTVNNAITAILDKEELDIIGRFMEDEVLGVA